MGNILIFLAGLVLLASGSAKLANVPPVVTELSNFGFAGGSLVLVGILEVFSAALFLIPQTRSIGLLLASSFPGGAIATHLQHGQSFFPPAIFLSLLWLDTWLRHPEALWSLHLLGKGRSDRTPIVTAHLSNKVALVTGGTDGVGKEVARGLAFVGHSVVLVGRDKEKGAQVERGLRDTTGNERKRKWKLFGALVLG